MGNIYVILGAGRQGTAAAYDVARFGDAEKVILADILGDHVESSARRINELLKTDIASGKEVDLRETEGVSNVMEEANCVISALPYTFNLEITKAAIRHGTNICDLGGHTETVLKQLKLDKEAKDAGISIVPDCGMGPGMNISLALYAMSLLDKPKEVYIWDGGLPQDPKPPWNYTLTFNIGGLSNEYYGNAYFLRDSRVTEVPCFSGYQELDFPPPLNRLEAFVTSGGLSTAPWTFAGKLMRLENRTLRYPGHFAQFSAFAQLGLLELNKIKVAGKDIVPREVLHTLLEPKITDSEVKDVGIIRVKCAGEKDGRNSEAVVELIDYHDEKTGFSAMQRLTGWHAGIISILSASGKIKKGAVPVETIAGPLVVNEARRRGFSLTEEVREIEG